MSIRFFFSVVSLEKNTLQVTHGNKGYFVKQTHDLYAAPIAEADIDGSYYFTTGNSISHPLLAASVTHMSILEFEKSALLTFGHYCGDGWEAFLDKYNHDGTSVALRVQGNNVEKLKAVYRQLVTGQLLPSFVIKGTQLTSEQVAAIVFGEGDREHWLHVVQSAQDTILRTAGTISFLEGQVAALQAKIAELSAH